MRGTVLSPLLTLTPMFGGNVKTQIYETTGKTDENILDAFIGQWWIIQTDCGQTYAKVIQWRRAFGRCDWIVKLFGDEVQSDPRRADRFIRQEDPPLMRQTGAEKIEMKKPVQMRNNLPDWKNNNPQDSGLRRVDDPMAKALEREDLDDLRKEAREERQGKRRRRRVVK